MFEKKSTPKTHNNTDDQGTEKDTTKHAEPAQDIGKVDLLPTEFSQGTGFMDGGMAMHKKAGRNGGV